MSLVERIYPKMPYNVGRAIPLTKVEFNCIDRHFNKGFMIASKEMRIIVEK